VTIVAVGGTPATGQARKRGVLNGRHRRYVKHKQAAALKGSATLSGAKHCRRARDAAQRVQQHYDCLRRSWRSLGCCMT